MIICFSPFLFSFAFFIFSSMVPILQQKIPTECIFITANNPCEKVLFLIVPGNRVWLMAELESRSALWTIPLARVGIYCSADLDHSLASENGKVLLGSHGLPKGIRVFLRCCWDNKSTCFIQVEVWHYITFFKAFVQHSGRSSHSTASSGAQRALSSVFQTISPLHPPITYHPTIRPPFPGT